MSKNTRRSKSKKYLTAPRTGRFEDAQSYKPE